MRCPVDNETLVMSDRNGIEIDYCPKCRGVWLDRGELDKIVDRAAGAAPAPTAPAPMAPRSAAEMPPTYHPEPRRDAPQAYREPSRRRDDDHDDDRRDDRHDRRPKRRESFLSDLFDF